MKLVMFSKMLKDRDLQDMVEWAHDVGIDGYDLCVRPGYAVNPDNVATALPAAVKVFADADLAIPMVTANFDVLWPTYPGIDELLEGMSEAGVRLLKLGYYKFNPDQQDYWEEVERIRKGFSDWQELGRRHGVKICYHTHSNRCMGLNGAALAHLIRGTDPACIGACIDAGHLAVEGEEFAVALAMVESHLSIVAVKDMLIWREQKENHGAKSRRVVPAGEGMVDWTAVFAALDRAAYEGPVSVHCEFKVPEGGDFHQLVKDEVAFFRRFVPKGE